MLEAPDFKTRMKWLEALQDRRRNWCKMASSAVLNTNRHSSSSVDQEDQQVTDVGDNLPGLSKFLSANYSAFDDNKEHGSKEDDAPATKKPTSIFYVDEASCNASTSGENKNNNDQMAEKSVKQRHSSPWKRHARSLQGEINRTNNIGAVDSAVDKVGKLMFKMSTSKKNCENCMEMVSVVTTLKTRCSDLIDEVAANRILVESLRANLLAAKNQTNAIQRLADFKETDQHKIDYVKESETERTYLHLQNSNLRKELNEIRDSVKKLESTVKQKTDELEAYKESLKSKDKMIMKLVEEQSQSSGGSSGRQCFSNDDCFSVDQAIEFENSSQDHSIGLAELKVNDVTENKLENLKDLLRGYEKQNQFLNKEILELHHVVQCLENREQHLARKNFDVEADYYQLKSRYLLLLNHFQPNKELMPAVIDELLKDAKEALLDMNANKRLDITDDLGFYLSSTNGKRPSHNGVESNCFIDLAGQFKRVSEELVEKQKKAGSEHYLAWLTKWDSLLVNYTDKTLGPCNELKELIRDGIPHAYRTRVWKSIVFWMVKETISEVGHGYFECLYKKANTLNLQDAYDPAMKQIDLDLTRTLPHNKNFEDLNASKIESLRRVLYAYRWHNTDIGYCQGLNRLAAVVLLYLNEEDAFWALVAIVEYLQPRDYYGHTMLAAQADQRVLRDFVVDKMPRVSSHLKTLEVDLSLFTFNWFLTVFVDSFLHATYLNIWDSFLYEGNKVLFRFALAVLKINENEILSCKTSNALHSCLSKLGENVVGFEKLSQVAFKDMNPFPSKQIETRRTYHLTQLKEMEEESGSQQFLKFLKQLPSSCLQVLYESPATCVAILRKLSGLEEVSVEEKYRKTTKELHNYGIERWECVLKYMALPSSETQKAISQDNRQILSTAGFVTVEGPNETPAITSAGFKFLLTDRISQLWIYLLNYLRYLEEKESEKLCGEQQAEKTALSIVEPLTFLFHLSFCTLGKAYNSRNLSDSMEDFLQQLREVGIVFQRKRKSGWFYPTPLAIGLSSASSTEVSLSSSLHDSLPGRGIEKGFLVVETNYRVYAYTDSVLQLAIVSTFTDMTYRFGNLSVGVLTRESVRRALQVGITSKQIVDYLKSNSHEIMYGNINVIPTVICDQLRLWELERDRFQFDEGALYSNFVSDVEFKTFRNQAADCNVLLWENSTGRLLVIRKEGVETMKQFWKQQKG